MSNPNQCTDSKQVGPGVKVTGLTPRDSSGNIPTSNGPSGAGVAGADKSNMNKKS